MSDRKDVKKPAKAGFFRSGCDSFRIQDIDEFAHPITLNFDGKSRFITTKCGGFLTFIMTVAIMAFTYTEVRDVYE